jgi:hypothetical protein
MSSKSREIAIVESSIGNLAPKALREGGSPCLHLPTARFAYTSTFALSQIAIGVKPWFPLAQGTVERLATYLLANRKV